MSWTVQSKEAISVLEHETERKCSGDRFVITHQRDTLEVEKIATANHILHKQVEQNATTNTITLTMTVTGNSACSSESRTANYNINYGVLKNKMSKKDLIEILNVCKKNKISKIDTASDYKNFSKTLNLKKNNWEIFTKIKISNKSFKKEFEKNLKN